LDAWRGVVWLASLLARALAFLAWNGYWI